MNVILGEMKLLGTIIRKIYWEIHLKLASYYKDIQGFNGLYSEGWDIGGTALIVFYQ